MERRRLACLAVRRVPRAAGDVARHEDRGDDHHRRIADVQHDGPDCGSRRFPARPRRLRQRRLHDDVRSTTVARPRPAARRRRGGRAARRGRRVYLLDPAPGFRSVGRRPRGVGEREARDDRRRHRATFHGDHRRTAGTVDVLRRHPRAWLRIPALVDGDPDAGGRRGEDGCGVDNRAKRRTGRRDGGGARQCLCRSGPVRPV